MNPELKRLQEADDTAHPWRRWGAYLSNRQWGTVREDYSADGAAWDSFPFEHARSRAYRWGEDGIGGLCDEQQLLCLSLVLHNGNDTILKERFFGLTNEQGNHGEDVKELYWYLDATPTGSWMRMLYKYPQAAFPYDELLQENARRDVSEREFELAETGVFDERRYWDVQIDQAKAAPEDLLYRVEVFNRGPEVATLDVLPQLTFRNTWSWDDASERPSIRSANAPGHVVLEHPKIGTMHAAFESESTLLWCENETNGERLWGEERAGRLFKDGINDFIVNGDSEVVRTGANEQNGTKIAARHTVSVAPGESAVIRVRLTRAPLPSDPFADFEAVMQARAAEADSFYAEHQATVPSAELRLVQRQAWAGMIWCKQSYHYDVSRWLDGDPAQPTPPAERLHGRNSHWRHLDNYDVISMPDDWEYPWYALWDLAFHTVVFASIDPWFAKRQLVLMTQNRSMHPNGALPAYEWALDDVNPPVHAWATWRVFKIDAARTGVPDWEFLERVFHRLLLNFTWWVNRKDANGQNVFEGGFLGLDNIGIFDRSAKMPEGGTLEQADGTSWMAMFSLTMMRMAIELATVNPVYQDLAGKFLEHFLQIADAMTNMGGDKEANQDGDNDKNKAGLWDENDEFYYDLLELPDGERIRLRIQSIVGLIPLFAVEVLEPETLKRVPKFAELLEWYFQKRPDLASLVSRWNEPGRGDRRLFSLLRGHRMKCLLRTMLDEEKFLSPFGVRSLSRQYKNDPYSITIGKETFHIDYEPGESTTSLFGGNSNWRGPIWFPINFLLIESLQRFHHYYGDDFKIEYPIGSGKKVTIDDVARELAERMTTLFIPNAEGERPAHSIDSGNANTNKITNDPNFKNLIHFHEYFDGDTGRGCGASHQTGWTGLIAKVIERLHANPANKHD